MTVQALYEIDGGTWVEFHRTRHLIPNPATLLSVFGKDPQASKSGASIPIGEPLTDPSFLCRHSSGAVYLVTQSKKYLIASPTALAHFQFNGNIYPRRGAERSACQFIADIFILALPTGQVIDITPEV